MHPLIALYFNPRQEQNSFCRGWLFHFQAKNMYHTDIFTLNKCFLVIVLIFNDSYCRNRI